MTIQIYNTLTRKKEPFIPIEEGKVSMYVCGPTVYNYIHIGNARPVIVFDTVRRYLGYRGYEVTYVSNFTDVDDKIIKAANELGEEVGELIDTFRDIAETGCDILTVGQYLAPTARHIPIEKYYSPDEFAHLKSEALAMGFRYVEAGPLVRSSYHAGRHTQGAAGAAHDYSNDPLFATDRHRLETTPLVQLKGRVQASD